MIKSSRMRLRNGGPSDATGTLALLDGAVAWLVSRGRTGQWGSKGYSERPPAVERIHEYMRDHLVRVAEDEGDRVVGVAVLSEQAPKYAPPPSERELYVRLMVTDRAHSGSGIGAALIADAVAETRRRGISLLRVDCYAGDDRKLVAQYVRLGFRETVPFEVPLPEDGALWPGQILEMRV